MKISPAGADGVPEVSFGHTSPGPGQQNAHIIFVIIIPIKGTSLMKISPAGADGVPEVSFGHTSPGPGQQNAHIIFVIITPIKGTSLLKISPSGADGVPEVSFGAHFSWSRPAKRPYKLCNYYPH